MNSTMVVVGLPESGKSSFIAALSHILEFREIETELTLEHLSDEAEYVYEMRAEWQGCRPFERTKGGIHAVSFHLESRSGTKSQLVIPDVAGEEFEEQWKERIWTPEFARLMKDASGILLFINAGKFEKPLSLADVSNAESALRDALGPDATESEQLEVGGTAELATLNTGEEIVRQLSAKTVTPSLDDLNPAIWNPRKADQQVKVVDILQGISNFAEGRKWRLAVIVSAWDVVRSTSKTITPLRWLEKNVAFLAQYLHSNSGRFECQVFGVSAQGGRPETEALRLQLIEAQSERVLVVGDSYEGHDLTRIVAWVASRNDA